MAPQKEPRSGVAAALLSTVFSAEPASDFKPSVMTVMPSRKRPMPPSTEIVVDMGAPQLSQPVVPYVAVLYFSRPRAVRMVCNSFRFSASTVG
jgi:hypothetical protein